MLTVILVFSLPLWKKRGIAAAGESSGETAQSDENTDGETVAERKPLGVALGPYDVEIRRGQSHCSFRGADRNGLGRLLRRPELLGVVADCHTIRSWRRRR